MQQQISALDNEDVVGLAGVLATALVHLLTVGSRWHGPFIILAVVGWAAYIVWSVRRDPAAIRSWGFRRQHLRKTAIMAGLLVASVSSLFAVFALAHGRLVFPAHIVLLLLLYPIWGLVQQFLVLGLVVNALRKLPVMADRTGALVLLGAFLFSMVHLNHLLLAVATFFGGLFFVTVYLKYRNLWPLGVAHGWLGTFFLLWVMGRDPWIENFGGWIQF